MSTWLEVSARLGRNDMPYALARAVFIDGTLTDPDEVLAGVTDAWTMSEWPMQALDAAIWMRLFEQAVDDDPGMYVHDGRAESRQDLPDEVVLYRGAVDGHERGMSWTDDLARAEWFAHRFDGLGGMAGTVWRVTVEPEVVLARFESRRGEAEWVLDPEWLEDADVAEQVSNQD